MQTRRWIAAMLMAGSVLAFGGEIRYGHGTITMQGGFIGLKGSIDTDISTYTLAEMHKNIGSSDWYYAYGLNWYDSDEVTNAQQKLQNAIDGMAGYMPSAAADYLPAIDYKFEGFDGNLIIGRDLIHQKERGYVGLGLLLGISLPWIDSDKSASNNDQITDETMKLMKSSKTKIETFKIGPSICGSYAFNRYFSLYGSATYAYQTGRMKNDYIDADLDVEGTFQEYDAGIRFQPVSIHKKVGFITLSPKFYMTAGYRYTKWQVDDVALDVTGAGVTFDASDFTSENSILYFGVGYDFF